MITEKVEHFVPDHMFTDFIIEDVLKHEKLFRKPMYVIARKKKFYWEIREKVF